MLSSARYRRDAEDTATPHDSFIDTIVAQTPAGRALAVTWADGHQSTFHYIWLRDNCPCLECRHPNGQRLIETSLIPPDIHPSSATLADDGALEIVWANNGHVSRFVPSWLRSNCYSDEEREKRRPQRTLWNAELLRPLPEAAYQDVTTSDDALRLWLAMIVDYGFAMLRGVPAGSGKLIEVVALFGYVRETNYGRFMDIRTVVDPINVAYTSLPLTAHTDNPYRDPVPSLQLLHCLSSTDIGGDSTVVDGFCVADALRDREPDKFKLLTTIPVRFRFSDKDTELEAEVTLIALNPRGEVIAVRVNGPTALPFDFASHLIEPYYDAYRTFNLMLESPEFQIRFKLDPGDLYIVDNIRVMHGRTEFSGGANRHLQACYADRDGLLSRLRVLNRAP